MRIIFQTACKKNVKIACPHWSVMDVMQKYYYGMNKPPLPVLPNVSIRAYLFDSMTLEMPNFLGERRIKMWNALYTLIPDQEQAFMKDCNSPYTICWCAL